MTPREAIARALYLRSGLHCSEAEWTAAWAWYQDPNSEPYRKDSAIGKAVATADKVLRLLEAAGVRAEVMS